jgi:hypothetical protein
MEHGIRGFSDVVISKYKDREPVLYLSEVVFTNIVTEGDYKVASGGQDGFDLLGWNTSSKSQFIIKTPVFSMNFLEMSAGGELQKQETLIHEVETIELDDTDTFDLSYLPVLTEVFKIYLMDKTSRIIVQEIEMKEIDEKTITLKSSYNNWIMIIYTYEKEAEIVNIGKFINKGFYTLYGKTTLTSLSTSSESVLYFHFPKVEIIHSFDLKMLNSSSPNQFFNIHCNAIKEDGSLVRLIKVD